MAESARLQTLLLAAEDVREHGVQVADRSAIGVGLSLLTIATATGGGSRLDILLPDEAR